MDNYQPRNYKIHLEPDLQSFLSKGIVEIELDLLNETSEITLNSSNIAIWTCEIQENGEFIKIPFKLLPKEEQLSLFLPQKKSGKVNIKIEFMNKINDQLLGFYKSKYKLGDEEKFIAVTQFEETYARQAFPCFDHPSKKSIFDIEFVIDSKLMGISNTPILEEKELENGKKLIKFEPTPMMSSYLLFFGVGEFEIIQEKSGEVLHRVITTPGKTKFGKFGLDFSRKSMEFGEKYTNVSYPLKKMDNIAIADFAFGAMENFGAITYRENLLLVYPNITSSAGLERIAEVIAHEWAHQWFGNLVTPTDWKYLWLNESFATLFGYAIADHYYPEWKILDQFLSVETKGAFERDSLLETIPIELPTSGDQVKINASTAPIIYNKGASVLQMIRGYLGEENFKKGINYFLDKYKFRNASSDDYWKSFENATGEPIIDTMKTWIHQPGYPQVTVKKSGNKLSLNQERFTFLPSETKGLWNIPITIIYYRENGQTQLERTLMTKKEITLELPANAIAYKLNVNQTGFYRVKYEEENLEKLGQLVKSKRIESKDRFGLQNDLYAFVRKGEYKIDDYLAFLKNYDKEDGFLPLVDISSNLKHAHDIIESKREEIKKIGKEFFGPILEKIGFEPKEDDLHTTSILRSTLLATNFRFEDEKVKKFGDSKFNELVTGGEVHPDILASVMRMGASISKKSFEWFIKKMESPETGEQEKINILTALGSFDDDKTLFKALTYTLEKVPNSNKFIPIMFSGNNLKIADKLWDWYMENIEKLEKLHHTHYERVIASVVSLGSFGREKEVKDFLTSYKDKMEIVKDTITLILEKLEINSRLRNA
ncbi:MAG: M1 family metallopeptidase [Candidatus Ranarchaeia archaeon]